jgi:hypothetical protein
VKIRGAEMLIHGIAAVGLYAPEIVSRMMRVNA